MQLNVTESAKPNHTGGASATYAVQADTQAPSAPTGLVATLKRNQVNLAWQAASDNRGVTGYEVWHNGALVTTVSATSYGDTVANGSYSYYVVARDAAGNRSSASNAVSVTVKGR